MSSSDGMNYAPKGKPNPVVKPGEFIFSVIALDHGHIFGMCNGLVEAGATIKYVYDPDPAKVEKFLKAFPQAKATSHSNRATLLSTTFTVSLLAKCLLLTSLQQQ